jgi:hypothetical protein
MSDDHHARTEPTRRPDRTSPGSDRLARGEQVLTLSATAVQLVAQAVVAANAIRALRRRPGCP